jgi:hypothetical protein
MHEIELLPSYFLRSKIIVIRTRTDRVKIIGEFVYSMCVLLARKACVLHDLYFWMSLAQTFHFKIF